MNQISGFLFPLSRRREVTYTNRTILNSYVRICMALLINKLRSLAVLSYMSGYCYKGPAIPLIVGHNRTI